MDKFYLGKIKNGNNTLSVFVGRQDADSIGFYDELGNLVAQKEPQYPLMASKDYRDMPPEFLTQINSLWQNLLQNSISVNERNSLLREAAKILGIDEEKVSSISKASVSQDIPEKDKKTDKLKIKEKNTSNQPLNNQNKDVLENIHAKEETRLDELVDDRHTLGDILGINDPNATLICVHSIDIEGERSNSEFSFLIKHSDGSLEKADMLSQEDGTSPDREVYSSNRDGSSVDRVPVRSMYRITSPTGQESMLSVSYGPTGTLNLQFGKRDITDQDRFMAVPLETDTTRYITKEVQDTIDPERGIYQAEKSTDEIAKHEKHNCKDMTLEEADGNENTGHQHIDDNHLLMIASNILNKNPELDEFYSVSGLANQLKNYIEKHHDMPTDKAIKEFTDATVEDCSHFKSIKR